MGGYTKGVLLKGPRVVVICLQISNFEWVDTPRSVIIYTANML